MMWERWATTVQQDHAIAVLEDLLVGIAGYHDIYRCREELEEFSYRSKAASQAVHHTDAPPVHIQHLQLLTAPIRDRIVVAGGTEHRSVLLQPVQDHGRRQVTTVQNQLDASEEPRRLRSKFIEVTDQVGQMGI
jgi:hypothetical protein